MKALLSLKVRLMKDNFGLYVVMIVMSLVIAGVFGNSMGGTYKPTLAVINTNTSVEVSDLLAKLSNTYDFNIKLTSSEEGVDLLSNRKVDMLLRFSSDFLDEPGGVEIMQLKSSVESFQLTNILNNEIELIKNERELANKITNVLALINPSIDNAQLSKAVKISFADQWQSKRPISVQTQVFETNDAITATMDAHYMIGMTLFFVTYSLMFTVGDILEDKRLHTYDRMMVAPVSRLQILLSNLVGAMLIGCFQIGLMIFSGNMLFNINWGSNLTLIIGIGFLYIFVVTAMSLFVVSLVKTSGQLGAVSPIVLTGMGMLGGCMWPLEIITSKALLFLADLTPHRWAMSAMKEAVLYGQINNKITTAMGILTMMGIVYLLLGERLMYMKSLKEN